MTKDLVRRLHAENSDAFKESRAAEAAWLKVQEVSPEYIRWRRAMAAHDEATGRFMMAHDKLSERQLREITYT